MEIQKKTQRIEQEAENYVVRDGIIVILINSIIPDGNVI